MFEQGDKIICVADGNDVGGYFYDLEVGEIYTIYKITQGIRIICIELYESDYRWDSKYFISLIEYRKLKIDKIRERCLKKVKE